MTIVVGVRCGEGAVLATDSQATAQLIGNIPIKFPTPKVYLLGDHIAYGATGDVGLIQRIQATFEEQLVPNLQPDIPKEQVGGMIVGLSNQWQKLSLAQWIQIPGSQPAQWGAIFCGWTNDEPWLFEVDLNGSSLHHSVIAATGSGYPLAHAALLAANHYRIEGQSLEAVKAIAYRAIENVCEASAYGVSGPVQMAVVTADGVEQLNRGDEGHTKLCDLVDLWKTREVETLGGLAPAGAFDSEPTAADSDAENEPSIEPPAPPAALS